MTDNEIIKALECCICDECEDCPHDEETACVENLHQEALDLINRQKAEIESSRKHTELWVKKFYEKKAKLEALQMDKEQLESDVINANMNCEHIKNIWESDYQKLSEVITKWKDQYKRLVIQEEDIRAEAVKEFAERLKAKAVDVGICDTQGNGYGGATVVLIGDIDNLVKEMVGEG